jgi:hypothetical protein
MDRDAAQVAAAVVPYVTAAVQAYGAQTLDKIREAAVAKAANASVEWGRRILARLVSTADTRQAMEQAVLDLHANPTDDAVAAICLQIRKALSNPELLREVTTLLAGAAQSTVSASASDFQVTQNAASFGNSKQAVLGSGVQNVTFTGNE